MAFSACSVIDNHNVIFCFSFKVSQFHTLQDPKAAFERDGWALRNGVEGGKRGRGKGRGNVVSSGYHEMVSEVGSYFISPRQLPTKLYKFFPLLSSVENIDTTRKGSHLILVDITVAGSNYCVKQYYKLVHRGTILNQPCQKLRWWGRNHTPLSCGVCI